MFSGTSGIPAASTCFFASLIAAFKSASRHLRSEVPIMVAFFIHDVRQHRVDSLVLDLAIKDASREPPEYRPTLGLFLIGQLRLVEVFSIDRHHDDGGQQGRLRQLLQDRLGLLNGNLSISKRLGYPRYLLFDFDFFLSRQLGIVDHCVDPLFAPAPAIQPRQCWLIQKPPITATSNNTPKTLRQPISATSSKSSICAPAPRSETHSDRTDLDSCRIADHSHRIADRWP